MSPVISERRRQEHFILHTGQHYSYNMDRVFFEQLGLPEARYNLEAGAHGERKGMMMAGIERVLMEESPDACMCNGWRSTSGWEYRKKVTGLFINR